jgi:hypothetical protein
LRIAETASVASTGRHSAAEVSSVVPKDPVSLEYWFEGAGVERTPVYEKIINVF